jgi:hypothetical protein
VSEVNYGSARAIALATAAFVCSAPAFAQMTPEEAFAADKSSGGENHAQQIKNSIGNIKAEEVIKDFSASPPGQASYWNGGNTVLSPLVEGGSNKITECTGAGLESTDPITKQHCEAVDAMARHPSTRPTNLIDSSDPILVQGNTVANDPEAVAGAIDGIYASCSTVTTERPESASLETCTEFSETGAASCSVGLGVAVHPDTLYGCRESLWKLEPGTCTYGHVIQAGTQYNYQCEQMSRPVTHKCARKITGEVVSQGIPNVFSHSSSVPVYTAKTYTFHFEKGSDLGSILLHRAYIDDWGQIWVNGVKVYDDTRSAMFGIGDWRHGTVLRNNPACGTVPGFGYSKTCFRYASGEMRNFHNNQSCGGDGCHDKWPNLDITSYFREGDNTIEIVCVNAQENGNCIINLAGNKRVFQESWISECVEYELRAGN